jgi:endo-1,4-beta-xylanase
MGDNAIPAMLSNGGSNVLFVSRNNKGSLSTNGGVTWSGAFNAYARDVAYSQTLDRYITAYANTFFPERKYAIIDPDDTGALQSISTIGSPGNVSGDSYAIGIGGGQVVIGTSTGQIYRAAEAEFNTASAFPEIVGDNASAINAIAYGNGRFVAVGAGGRALSFGSGDSAYVTTATMIFHDVVYSPGLNTFVAVGNDGESGRIFTSENGIDWINRPISASYKLQPHNQSIIWNPVIEKFVVLREDDRSKLLISADGINWSETVSGESHLRSIYWDGSRYIVSKNNGGAAYTLLTSTSTAFPLTFTTAGSVSPTGAYMGDNAIPVMLSNGGSSVLFVSRNNKGSLSTNGGATWSGAFNAYARDVAYSQTLDRYITAYANTFFPERKYAVIDPNDAGTLPSTSILGSPYNVNGNSYAIAVGNGNIIVGTSTGRIYRSDEGTFDTDAEFNEISGGNTAAIHAVTYGNGRFVAAGAGTMLSFNGGITTYSTVTQSLKETYKNYFPIGAAVQDNRLTIQDYADTLKNHFSSLTAEGAMKWNALQSTEGVYTFQRADAIIDFAIQHNMEVRGHTLVWDGSMPDWVFEDGNGQPASRELLLERMQEHIQTVMTHFKGKVSSWDVVNEAVSDVTGATYKTSSKWYQIIGDDFVKKAFEYAHAADPDVQLYYNDYNLEDSAKRARAIAMITDLQQQGLRIDGVGLQSHMNVSWPNMSQIEAAIQDFAALGLDVEITELDVSVYPKNSTLTSYTLAMLEVQAEKYKQLFELFRKYQGTVKKVTFWGVSDKYTWLNGYLIPGRVDAPLLFDTNYLPKEAFWKAIDFGG